MGKNVSIAFPFFYSSGVSEKKKWERKTFSDYWLVHLFLNIFLLLGINQPCAKSNIKKHIHFGSIDKQSPEIHSNNFDGEKKKIDSRFYRRSIWYWSIYNFGHSIIYFLNVCKLNRLKAKEKIDPFSCPISKHLHENLYKSLDLKKSYIEKKKNSSMPVLSVHFFSTFSAHLQHTHSFIPKITKKTANFSMKLSITVCIISNGNLIVVKVLLDNLCWWQWNSGIQSEKETIQKTILLKEQQFIAHCILNTLLHV